MDKILNPETEISKLPDAVLIDRLNRKAVEKWRAENPITNLIDMRELLGPIEAVRSLLDVVHQRILALAHQLDQHYEQELFHELLPSIRFIETTTKKLDERMRAEHWNLRGGR
jgi:hypothetical protein